MKSKELSELKQELKELYAVIEYPSDDGYWPEVQERIEQIIKQINEIQSKH